MTLIQSKKKINFIIVLLLLTINNVYSQSFEGTIDYDIKYTSKSPNFPIKGLEQEYGSKSNLFVKNGFYKELTNSNFMAFQLFRHNDPNVYFRDKKDQDTLRAISSIDTNTIAFEIEIIENADTILNLVCNQLIYKDSYGTKTYTYFPEYSLDPSFYQNYTYANFNEVISEMKAVYLKLEMEYEFFTVEVVATNVERKKISKKEFKIPKHKFLKIELI